MCTLFNKAEMGNDNDNNGPTIAPTMSLSDPLSNCTNTFVTFLAVDLALALVFIMAMLAICCHLPAFCASIDHIAVISMLVRVIGCGTLLDLMTYITI
jgi:hypothetical protein